MQTHLERDADVDAGRWMTEAPMPDNAPMQARMGGQRPRRLLERAQSGQLSFYDGYCLWREHGDEPGFDLAARLDADMLSEHLRVARLLLSLPPYASDRNMARFADYLLGATLDRLEASASRDMTPNYRPIQNVGTGTVNFSQCMRTHGVEN